MRNPELSDLILRVRPALVRRLFSAALARRKCGRPGGGKNRPGSGPTGPKPKRSRGPREDRLIAERLRGRTLQAIADAEAPPLTHERVRQLIERWAAPGEKAQIRDIRRPLGYQSILPSRMVFCRWLYAAGYRRCSGACKLWLPAGQFGAGSRRCRTCARTYQASLWVKDHEGMLARSRAYKLEHPDVQIRASARWVAKKKLRASA